MPHYRDDGKEIDRRHDSPATQAANPISFRHFVRFLRDTQRIDWATADALLAEMKGHG